MFRLKVNLSHLKKCDTQSPVTVTRRKKIWSHSKLFKYILVILLILIQVKSFDSVKIAKEYVRAIDHLDDFRVYQFYNLFVFFK